MRFSRFPLVRFFALVVALVAVPALDAQTGGTVRGRVVEAGSGRPLGNVQVVVEGTARGAISSDAGAFVLTNVPAGRQTIRTKLLGFTSVAKPVDVAAGAAATLDFTLSAAAITLDEIVVTGTAGAVSKRTLGNAISTIDAADLAQKTVISNVTEMLQGKATGVTVMSSSGSAGTAGTIRIRGQGSLATAINPVVYVDGVRISSGHAGNFRNSWQTPSANTTQPGAGQDASLLDAINPEDIESIEVIKGPAAATLYGADAANGVIQIITKRGRPGEQRAQWRAKFQGGSTGWALDKRPSFTTCSAERIAARLPDGRPSWPGCAGSSPGSVLTRTSLDTDGALRSGQLRNVALSLQGGGDGFSYFTAADHDREEGVFTNNSTERAGARANFSFFPSAKVNYAVSFGFTRTDTRFPQGDDATNLLESAWTFQPGASLGRGQIEGFAAGSPQDIALYDNRLRQDRATFGTTLNISPVSWFVNRLTVGADVASGQANRYVAPGSLWSPSDGQMTQGAPRNNVYTVDYAGTVNSKVPFTALTSALSFGTQYTNRQFRNTIAQGNGYPSGSVRDIGLAAKRHSWSEFIDVKSLGFYAQEQVGWNDRLFLTGALRVDNSSVFGDDIKQLYYPKLAASWVVSEESFAQRDWLDQLKLRAAWGQAGNAPDPFAAVQSYTAVANVDNVTGQPVPSLRLQSPGNPEVKPERGNEIELGFDVGFLKNRLGAEFTYYNKVTSDALMAVPTAPSFGYVTTVFQNIGEIKNNGIELALTATPWTSRSLTWDARLGYSTNSNELVQFGYKRGPLIFGLTTPNQRHVEGYPIGGFWVHDPVRQSDGSYAASEARYAGPANPTKEASFANTFTILQNLRLYTLLDYKGGFYVTNQTDWRRCIAGVCEEVNDPNVSAEQKRILQLDLPINDALYTQKGDFIKLRDVSLSYTLPSTFTRIARTEQATLTLAAHNLGILWKPHYKGLDPEVNFAGDNGPTGAWANTRVDYWTMPMTRRVTLSLDVTF